MLNQAILNKVITVGKVLAALVLGAARQWQDSCSLLLLLGVLAVFELKIIDLWPILIRNEFVGRIEWTLLAIFIRLIFLILLVHAFNILTTLEWTFYFIVLLPVLHSLIFWVEVFDDFWCIYLILLMMIYVFLCFIIVLILIQKVNVTLKKHFATLVVIFEIIIVCHLIFFFWRLLSLLFNIWYNTFFIFWILGLYFFENRWIQVTTVVFINSGLVDLECYRRLLLFPNLFLFLMIIQWRLRFLHFILVV